MDGNGCGRSYFWNLSQANWGVSKENSLMEEKVDQLFQKTNKKLFGAPIPRQECNNNCVKQKGRALLPPLQQPFSYSFPKKRCDFLTPWASHTAVGCSPLYFTGSRTTKAFPSCSLPKLLQCSILGTCPWHLPLAVRSHLPIQPMNVNKTVFKMV